jgi:hypothetical protein
MYLSPRAPGLLNLAGGSLKRKIGYDEEDIGSTGERLGRMDIDNNSNRRRIGSPGGKDGI